MDLRMIGCGFSLFFLLYLCPGGLQSFRELYPEWVETAESKKLLAASASTSSSSAEPSPDPYIYRPGEVPLLGLGSLASLKIQDDPDACDSCIGLDPDDVSVSINFG